MLLLYVIVVIVIVSSYRQVKQLREIENIYLQINEEVSLNVDEYYEGTQLQFQFDAVEQLGFEIKMKESMEFMQGEIGLEHTIQMLVSMKEMKVEGDDSLVVLILSKDQYVLKCVLHGSFVLEVLYHWRVPSDSLCQGMQKMNGSTVLLQCSDVDQSNQIMILDAVHMKLKQVYNISSDIVASRRYQTDQQTDIYLVDYPLLIVMFQFYQIDPIQFIQSVVINQYKVVDLCIQNKERLYMVDQQQGLLELRLTFNHQQTQIISVEIKPLNLKYIVNSKLQFNGCRIFSDRLIMVSNLIVEIYELSLQHEPQLVSRMNIAEYDYNVKTIQAVNNKLMIRMQSQHYNIKQDLWKIVDIQQLGMDQSLILDNNVTMFALDLSDLFIYQDDQYKYIVRYCKQKIQIKRVGLETSQQIFRFKVFSCLDKKQHIDGELKVNAVQGLVMESSWIEIDYSRQIQLDHLVKGWNMDYKIANCNEPLTCWVDQSKVYQIQDKFKKDPLMIVHSVSSILLVTYSPIKLYRYRLSNQLVLYQEHMIDIKVDAVCYYTGIIYVLKQQLVYKMECRQKVEQMVIEQQLDHVDLIKQYCGWLSEQYLVNSILYKDYQIQLDYQNNKLVIMNDRQKIINKLGLGGYLLDKNYKHRMEQQYLIIGVYKAILIYDMDKGSQQIMKKAIDLSSSVVIGHHDYLFTDLYYLQQTDHQQFKLYQLSSPYLNLKLIPSSIHSSSYNQYVVNINCSSVMPDSQIWKLQTVVVKVDRVFINIRSNNDIVQANYQMKWDPDIQGPVNQVSILQPDNLELPSSNSDVDQQQVQILEYMQIDLDQQLQIDDNVRDSIMLQEGLVILTSNSLDVYRYQDILRHNRTTVFKKHHISFLSYLTSSQLKCFKLFDGNDANSFFMLCKSYSLCLFELRLSSKYNHYLFRQIKHYQIPYCIYNVNKLQMVGDLIIIVTIKSTYQKQHDMIWLMFRSKLKRDQHQIIYYSMGLIEQISAIELQISYLSIQQQITNSTDNHLHLYLVTDDHLILLILKHPQTISHYTAADDCQIKFYDTIIKYVIIQPDSDILQLHQIASLGNITTILLREIQNTKIVDIDIHQLNYTVTKQINQNYDLINQNTLMHYNISTQFILQFLQQLGSNFRYVSFTSLDSNDNIVYHQQLLQIPFKPLHSIFLGHNLFILSSKLQFLSISVHQFRTLVAQSLKTRNITLLIRNQYYKQTLELQIQLEQEQQWNKFMGLVAVPMVFSLLLIVIYQFFYFKRQGAIIS